MDDVRGVEKPLYVLIVHCVRHVYIVSRGAGRQRSSGSASFPPSEPKSNLEAGGDLRYSVPCCSSKRTVCRIVFYARQQKNSSLGPQSLLCGR